MQFKIEEKNNTKKHDLYHYFFVYRLSCKYHMCMDIVAAAHWNAHNKCLTTWDNKYSDPEHVV